MRFVVRDEFDASDDHEEGQGYIHEDQALEFVFENQWDAIERAVKTKAAENWLSLGSSWLELLNIVSRHDKEELKEAIRKEVSGAHSNLSEDIPEPQLFAVASDAARLLENIGSPYAKYCSPAEDLSWAKNLINLTRAFREVLILISEPEDSWMVHYHLRKPVEEINSALALARPEELFWRTFEPKARLFFRQNNPASTPLHSYIAGWLCEFLIIHRSNLSLALCTECGTIFIRERRDNVYCSKTCQNRVAYKRKKIFESGALLEEKVDPDSPSAVKTGMWFGHPRLGLGRIEGVRFTDRTLWVQYKDHGFGERILENATAQDVLAKVTKERKQKPVTWEEIVDPGSIELRVRFLQFARTFKAWELFPRGKKEDSVPTFYRVANAKALIDLL